MIETNIHWLNNDIEWLWASLELLRWTRDNLQHFSTLNKGTLSSIWCFPPEICTGPNLWKLWQAICWNSLPICFSLQVLEKCCRVNCKSMDIILFPLVPERQESKLNMAQDWLSRSKELPITFTLGCHYGNTITSHPCTKLLTAHVHHWQDATIRLSHTLALPSVFTQFDTSKNPHHCATFLRWWTGN